VVKFGFSVLCFSASVANLIATETTEALKLAISKIK
jgi:hypothetical protein